MRVLLVSDTYAPQVNGVATSVRNLARTLAADGHAVALCAVGGEAPSLDGEREPFSVLRVRGVRLPIYAEYSVASPLGRAIAHQVAAFRPDLVHVHTPFSVGWQGMRAARALGVPLVGTHHTLFGEYVSAYSRLGGEVNQHISALARRYVATFYNRCDLVTCASRFLADDLARGGLRVPAVVVSNQVDTDRFQPLSHQRRQRGFRIVYFGRLAPEKNLPMLLALIEPLLRQNSRARFEIIGDGPVRPQLEALTRERGLDRQVRFTGFLRGEALARRVASSDCCVSASLTENQPMALLESLACGVPVVALAAAGVPEIIADGVTGYLVAPEAASAAFSTGIERLMSDDALRKAMGGRARAAALRYSSAACLTATLAAYQRAVEAHGIKTPQSPGRARIHSAATRARAVARPQARWRAMRVTRGFSRRTRAD